MCFTSLLHELACCRYRQVLTWLTTVITPFMPLLTFALSNVLLGVEFWTMNKNFRPPSHPWSPVKITTSFFLLLLISMLISLLPNTIWLTLKVKCGPFQGYESPLDVISVFMTEGAKNPSFDFLPLTSITVCSPGFCHRSC